MDREQEEMQSMGLFGIYKESCKLIYKWRKIFTQITLTLIFPLCIIFLSHQKISDILESNLDFDEFLLNDTLPVISHYITLRDLVSSKRITYILFQIAYFTLLLGFSLLSSSAVIYTVASVYTSREVTYKKVMRVVPKVWKRLMVTFLCLFLALVLYNGLLILFIVLWCVVTRYDPSTFGIVVIVVVVVLYAVGLVYMIVIWQLSSVVTVLEDSCGFKAMIKSKNLIKGKLVVSVFILVKLNLLLAAVDLFFRYYVVDVWRGRIVKMVGFGVLCFLLLFVLILFVLVVQTVIYFVCKSYHHETIDKSALSEHLEVYLGDYVRLMPNKDVQMEAYEHRV